MRCTTASPCDVRCATPAAPQSLKFVNQSRLGPGASSAVKMVTGRASGGKGTRMPWRL